MSAFVPLDNEAEAHFVCAAINSSPSVLVVKSYGIETQTSTHVLEHVGLPKFNANDNLHHPLPSDGRGNIFCGA
jgi:hypothetical protein